MNRAEFDKLFDEAIGKIVKEQPLTPDPDESWRNIKDRIGARANGRHRARRKYAAIAVLFIAVVVVFGSPAISEAYHLFRFIIKSIQQDAISLIYENGADRRGDAKTAPPPDDESAIVRYEDKASKLVFDNWDEAKSMLAFSPPEIGHIPDSCRLDQVMLFVYEGGGADRAMLFYSAPDKDQSFTIVFQKIGENEIHASTSDLSAGRFAEVTLNGANGILLEHVDGAMTLELTLGHLVVVISGELSEDEIIRIGRSISVKPL